MSNSYTAKDIEILEGILPVQTRPGMYTDTSNPNHLIQEVIDNAVDEAINGHCSKIDVLIKKNGTIEIDDNGRGIPVDLHKKSKTSAVEVIFTTLHSGAKFSNRNYRFAGGLHGVGISVVNALSDTLTATICKNGKRYKIGFTKGILSDPLKVIEKVGSRTHGSNIAFNPNAQYFDSLEIAENELLELLMAKALLCPGLQITYSNQGSAVKKKWCYAKGLVSYLAEFPSYKQCLHSKPIIDSCSNDDGTIEAEWGLLWGDNPDIITKSFVNLIPTLEHGSHVAMLKNGIVDALRSFCTIREIQPKNIKLTADDFLDTLSFIMSLRMTNPQFVGQTKRKLTSKASVAFIASVLSGQLNVWLNTHIEYGEAIVQQAIQRATLRMQKSAVVSRKKVVGGPKLPGKLVDCTHAKGSDTELFLVEGDSAGGSAKQARDRRYQAILPLRGKILNSWELSSSKALDSNEISDIATAIGIEPGNPNIKGLRYDKICILADADSDGAHISALLVALFVKHFPALVKAGHIYVVLPPLYRIDIGSEVHYALSDRERDSIINKQSPKNKMKAVVQRFKGLGEMNPQQLRETTIDATKRRMQRLKIDKESEVTKMMDLLLTKSKSQQRKKWLESRGNMASV